MSEQENDNQRPPEDPADALADMGVEGEAEISPVDHGAEADPLAALTEMDRGRGDAVGNLDRLARGEAGDEGPEVPAVVMESLAAPARRAATAARRAGHSRVRALEYYRFMVPVSLVMAVLLILVGLLAAGLVLPDVLAAERQANPRLGMLAVVSFAMAAAALLASWWFRKELRR